MTLRGAETDACCSRESRPDLVLTSQVAFSVDRPMMTKKRGTHFNLPFAFQDSRKSGPGCGKGETVYRSPILVFQSSRGREIRERRPFST